MTVTDRMSERAKYQTQQGVLQTANFGKITSNEY